MGRARRGWQDENSMDENGQDIQERHVWELRVPARKTIQHGSFTELWDGKIDDFDNYQSS